MTGQNFKAAPMSWKDIRAAADSFRQAFGVEDRSDLPVIDLLERVMDQRLNLISVEIWSRDDMGDDEGQTCQAGQFIRLREDVYEAVCRGDGRARFTVAHEIGHWHLHANRPLVLPRANEKVPSYQLTEPQANQYAAELLMPVKFFSNTDSVMDVMMRHGVTSVAAGHRLSYLRKEGLIK